MKQLDLVATSSAIAKLRMRIIEEGVDKVLSDPETQKILLLTQLVFGKERIAKIIPEINLCNPEKLEKILSCPNKLEETA